LIKNCNFRENNDLNERLQTEICLDIPSAKEAIVFAMYTNICSSFLLSREQYLRLVPPESLCISHFARKGQNIWFGAPSLPLIEIPEIPVFPFRSLIEKIRINYPQIFSGEKHLIIVTRPASESKHRRKQQEAIYVNVLDNIAKSGKRFTDFVLLQLPEITYANNRKEFYVPEDFFEYMTGIVFRKMGYLVGKPVFPSSDDAGAYLYPGLVSYLRENNLITEKGGFFGEIFLSENSIEMEKIDEIPLRTGHARGVEVKLSR
jgi:hypothetical protein